MVLGSTNAISTYFQWYVAASAAVPGHFNADPDPSFHCNVGPDPQPTFHLKGDPDSALH
jgi:hypothetical protein